MLAPSERKTVLVAGLGMVGIGMNTYSPDLSVAT